MSQPDTPAETASIAVERSLPHAPAKVWRALTQGALIEDWLMKNDFEPVVGHAFTLNSQPMPPHWDGVIRCKVLEVEPPTRLVYSWEAFGVDTRVTYTLTAEGAGTHLKVEQAGFDPQRQDNIRGATYGWTRFTGQLEQVLTGLAD
jgi:uncharacterized protein YndB with AHSA1/START domain